MTNSTQRPSWDEYFINILDAIAQRATCDRGKSGAIIVKNNHILATGYVGAPSGLLDCDEIGHLFEERVNKNGIISKHCIRTIHAEQNAVAQAAKYGIAIENATIFCTMEPCLMCAKLLVASGIKRVVAKHAYHAAESSRSLLKEASIELILLNADALEY